MPKVLLGDVALEHKETCKEDKDRYPTVGLEHLVSGDITLTAWSESAENTFTKMFRKGNVLFGRRRAYLKKAAVAPFDGICSGDITVIEARPEKILPELLPFIIQNDDFFNFAVEKSAGSLSPRVKWEHLKNYEFELPNMDRQKKLVELLWSINDTMRAYKKLISATDELVKSQFIEMFGIPETNPKGFKMSPLGDIATVTKLAGFEYTKYIKYQNQGDIIMVRGLNCKSGKLVLDDIYWIDKEVSEMLPRSRLEKGDLVLTYVGTVGEVAMIDKDNMYHLAPNVAKISLKDKTVNIPLFWDYMLMVSKEYILRFASTTTQSSLSMERIRKIPFILPDTERQEIFVKFIKQSDKSKLELEKALSELTGTYKQIIAENLG